MQKIVLKKCEDGTVDSEPVEFNLPQNINTEPTPRRIKWSDDIVQGSLDHEESALMDPFL